MISRLLHGVKSNPVIWLTGFVSAVLLIYMNLHHGPLFSELTTGRTIPDSDFSATPESLLALRRLLVDRPEAASVLRNMHLYADMALPVFLGTFMFVSTRKLARGVVIYGRDAGRFLHFMLLVPVFYVVSDYSENLVSFLLFPPSNPGDALAHTLAQALFWLTRLKFMFAAVSVLIIVRLLLGRTVVKPDNL